MVAQQYLSVRRPECGYLGRGMPEAGIIRTGRAVDLQIPFAFDPDLFLVHESRNLGVFTPYQVLGVFDGKLGCRMVGLRGASLVKVDFRAAAGFEQDTRRLVLFDDLQTQFLFVELLRPFQVHRRHGWGNYCIA